jgi:hypothetical protein
MATDVSDLIQYEALRRMGSSIGEPWPLKLSTVSPQRK